MRSPEEFDNLYKDVRDRLLVEAYVLTGDQHVSRTAVRDAFTVAWHHWDKVRGASDREAWLRPLVWKRAKHRHAARPWHREKDLDEESSATLEALSTLSMNQRKALVLTHYSPVPLAEMAREIGLPPQQAQAESQAAGATFALARHTTPESIPAHLAALGSAIGDNRWPRSSILRRAGTARRRGHTVVGVLATTAAVVLSGMVVAQGETPGATLSDQGFERRATKVEATADEPVLTEEMLLTPRQVRRVDPGLAWSESTTSTNTEGNGLVMPCQGNRFADAEGLGAVVRTFEGTQKASGNKKKQRRQPPARTASATEFVELSASEEQAADAYAVARSWFAGCSTDRVQLMSVHDLKGVGDEASLFTLRSWRGPTRTIQVGVARSGQMVTTAVGDVAGMRHKPRPVASLLAASVNARCGATGAGACASPPKARPTSVPVAGSVPGMLSEFDLPPVTRAKGPWVGTDPAKPRVNVASTRCDRTVFMGKGIKNNLTRTFLFPQARRAGEFGLTQTVATMRGAPAARKFVGGVRDRVDRCAKEGFGTDVTRLAGSSSKNRDLTVWRLELEVSENESLEFLMAIMRQGSTVAQVGFVPASGLSMSRSDFVWLARRALQRLPRLQLETR
ncbi:sigma-70 family RNA polymerase sigma factor [Nocardioides houyundeii]|uniref:sigma-70 family RNA polymerase sigma factor n=1 Tax=Nocardioides houyundeii TaxID=2045452 RepID=UPI000C78B499|nr:sigma-70 family RNA polymerase sigma factor [Nocardioides houyundeii]